MKRVIFEYLTLAEARYLSEQVETLVMVNGYCEVLDLFSGEPYFLKGIDVEGRGKGAKYSLDTMVKVSLKDGKTMVDKRLLEDICNEISNLADKNSNDFSATDRQTWVQYMCLTMLNLKIAEDKEFIVSEKDVKTSIKPSKYRYNKNKPTIISNIVYAKKEPQGRKYEKQADNWLVRTHYRVRNGVKYLVKGYEKTFK